MILFAPGAAKACPDAKDREIVAMMQDGLPMREIRNRFGDTRRSIEQRIRWMQATRWMTFDKRLLTEHQRHRLLCREKEFIEVEGV